MKNYASRVAGIATLALAALPMLALSTTVHAQTPQARVQVADLNLASTSGQAAYHQRLDAAANRVCADEKALGSRDACKAGVRAEVNAKLAAHVQYAARG